MALYVQTNVSSLFTQNQLASTQNSMSTTFQRLSSGYRINGASDDAAGLGISESMNSQVRSFTVAERNAMDGISMVQTADAAAGQISSLLTRLRELALQSSNGALVSNDRVNLETEFTAVSSEIDRIANVTKFNSVSLLNNGASTDFQVGIFSGANEKITVNFAARSLTTTALGVLTIGSTATSALAAISALDSAMQALNTQRETFGAGVNRLQQAVTNIQTARTNLSAALGRIRDVDVAEEAANMTKWQVLTQAGTSVLSQANQAPQAALSLLRG
jgi:flagellin